MQSITHSGKKAIHTRYLSPTNFKGARCKAQDEDGNSVTLPWEYSLRYGDMYAKAARALCDKMGWGGNLIGGAVKDGHVWVFVD